MKKQLNKVKTKSKDEKTLKEQFNKALDETAKIVGHNSSTLKNQYLIPSIQENYLEKGTIKIASKDPIQTWIKLNVKSPKTNCFFYAATLTLLFPELTLYAGKHEKQYEKDTFHFWTQKNNKVYDPTKIQYPKGELKKVKEINPLKNIDFVIKDPLFKTLPRKDQITILDKIPKPA